MDHSLVLDNIITQLRTKPKFGILCNYEYLIQQLCPIALQIFSAEPSLLELQAPINIAGDLHGQYSTLQTIFRYGGYPPQSNYLFLGNMVGQSVNSMDTILLLLALKIKYPTNIFLVKGNLEAGIPLLCVDEIDEDKYDSSDSKHILYDCLKSLPISAIINDKIICTHGGLSRGLHSLDQIRHIMRPTPLPFSRLLLDLLGPHSRRFSCLSHVFLPEEVQFLKKSDLHLVCCGLGQVVSNYKDFSKHRVVSISSASDNLTKCDIIVLSVDPNLKCSFHNLRHQRTFLWSYQIMIITPTSQNESSSGVILASGTTISNNSETSKPYSGSDTGKTESRPGINPSKLDFNPTIYRSKSPGVKRFIGARV